MLLLPQEFYTLMGLCFVSVELVSIAEVVDRGGCPLEGICVPLGDIINTVNKALIHVFSGSIAENQIPIESIIGKRRNYLHIDFVPLAYCPIRPIPEGEERGDRTLGIRSFHPSFKPAELKGFFGLYLPRNDSLAARV